jgi:phosphoribosylformimino-5-aminoimidazole carboxamide ribotide isomerase
MELWPAIDVRAGRCVRLVRGDFGTETIYGDPLEVAAEYSARGAARLHVVDLDAARDGVPVHGDLILTIARETGTVVQAGGGIRDERSAAALLEAGVSRVVVGTAAIEDPPLLERLSRRWPGRIGVGLDYRRGVAGGEPAVALHGWTETSGMSLVEAARTLVGLDLAAVVATDISRDGTAAGPDLAGLAMLLTVTGHEVVASGGVGTGGDLRRLRALVAGGRALAGVVVGRALLSGGLELEEALQICEGDL